MEMNERVICGEQKRIKSTLGERWVHLEKIVTCDKLPHPETEVHYDHTEEYGWLSVS